MTVSSPPTRHASSRPQRGRRRGRDLGKYLFILPAVLYLLVFTAAPMLQGLLISFTDAKLINPNGGNFIGTENYEFLFGSDAFWHSMWTTVIYTFITVVFALVLGTAAALALNRAFRGRTVVRALMTFPYAMPTVAAALIFIWIFNPTSGALNKAIGVLGIGQIGWLTDPEYGLISVLIATIWKVFPFVMLVVLAALQSVPDELYEASRVDGADGLSTFRAVVIPHITPTLRIVALLMTIWSIRRFEIIFLLTGGGPSEATNTLVVNIYRRAFSEQDLGTAAAIGMLGLVLSLLVTVVFFIADRRQSRREGTS
ncbi:MAG TPA: sugar ABC transporter permease [Candidatus Stackebrandtia excrementipullorum]|nr:sugar ABC transporter permease [Candidatus Stackebrandtia excrementipullorum]